MTQAQALEAYAKKEWEAMTEAEKAKYDNDFDFFVYDLYFCMKD